MNKRKTLRMTSILLALMMFFGMVSVLLVPAGTAGAADENVFIEVDVDDSQDAATLASNNYLRLPQATSPYYVTITVTEDIWKDAKDFSEVLLTFENPNGGSPAGLTDISMTNIGNGKWQYKFLVNSNRMTGLWAIKVYRKDSTWVDTVPFYTGIFWIYEEIKADGNKYSSPTTPADLFYGVSVNWNNIKSRIADASSNFVPTSAKKEAYVAPGTKLTLQNTPKVNVDYIKYMGIDNATIAEKTDLPASLDTVQYTIPSNATHLKEFEIKALAYSNGSRGAGKTELAKFAANGTGIDTKVDRFTIIVDAEGPSVEDAILQNNAYLGWIWDDGIVVKDYNTSYSCAPHAASFEHNFVEVRDIADADSGAGDGYVLFENPFNASVKMGSLTETKLKQGDALTSPFSTHSYYIQSGLSDDSYLFCISEPRHSAFAGSTLAATKNEWYDAKLLNNRWRVKIVAADAVGNETTTTVGIYDFLGTYQQISSIRVEQQNVLEMYVGQTINYEDVLFNGVKVAVNELTTAATFPDNYIWFGKNDTATLKLFSFDYDEQTITAVEAGEGYIYVEPWVNYNKEAASTNASTNGYMKVIVHAQPTVSSITLSSSKLQLAVGAEHKLTATTVPAGVTATWSSTDTAVATVDQNGNVKAVAAGTTTVSVAAGGKYAVCTVTVTDTTIPPVDPPAEKIEGWKDEGNNRYYYVDNQKVVGWRKIDGSWYFFDYSTAAMRANGWLKEGGKWYYLNSNGTMKSAEWFKDNNGKWYWLKANGAMAAGWEKINGTWYYFNASGAMQTGWVNVRGIWYYMKSSGAMAEGWLQDGSSWYYLTPGGGAMVTGRVTINGRASNFAASGRWLGYV